MSLPGHTIKKEMNKKRIKDDENKLPDRHSTQFAAGTLQL